ncbi:sulfotransferase [Pleurocapsales cyanobacterium LEGE 10410]|nr:sulfotransferase [Pleurocapsales cyanobacterium LEGE 10410]
MQKNFILGIGSQRAGSTFITELLNQHPEIAIHPLKELHYFDTVFGLRNESVLKEFSQAQFDREINKVCNAKDLSFVNPKWQWYLKTNQQLLKTSVSKIKYLDLFANVTNIDNIKFTGECTPEYMLLNLSQIEVMKSIVGDAHIIIMCRNPVKRMISSFRLLLEGFKQNMSHTQESYDAFFLKLINNNDNWIVRQMNYNNYSKIIDYYSKVFDKVLYLSYDDLIDNPQNILDLLSQFVDLDFSSKNMISLFNKKINSLSLKYSPNALVRSKLENLLENQIEDLNSLFVKPLIH